MGISRVEACFLPAKLSGAKVSLWRSDTACTVGEIIVGG